MSGDVPVLEPLHLLHFVQERFDLKACDRVLQRMRRPTSGSVRIDLSGRGFVGAFTFGDVHLAQHGHDIGLVMRRRTPSIGTSCGSAGRVA